MLWAPWFPLLTMNTLLCLVKIGTNMTDVDIGEMCLNFVLHTSLTMLGGIDFRHFFPEEIPHQGAVLHEVWGHSLMGEKPLPYICVQGLLRLDKKYKRRPKRSKQCF